MREYLVLVTSGEITAADVAAIASQNATKSQKAKTKKSSPGLSFRTEEGLEISVRLPAQKNDVRWTYHHVAEALAEVSEDVSQRIKAGVDLTC